jgi:predicted O-methyltransferase YrrM
MSQIAAMRVGNYLIGFQDFLNFLEEFSDLKNSTVVEIGSYAGESTIMFAQRVKSVIAIDPFVNDYDLNDGTCFAADLPTTVYQRFLENISPYNNITHIQKTSDDAVADLAGQQFDVVYIDGVHTYEQVKKDIENYRGLVKPGGFLCGHDYGNVGHIAGVYRAVNEAFGKPDVTFIDMTWVIRF